MMRRIISIVSILSVLFTAVMTGGCQKKETLSPEGGWAHSITDRTVIVSVFEAADAQEERLVTLSEALAFITRELKSYAAKTDFIYDWSEDEELRQYFDFGAELTGEGRNPDIAGQYILESGSHEKLLQKYKADSIVYVFFVDAGAENRIPSESYMWTREGDPEEEFIVLYDYVNHRKENYAAYAHEILHVFGARDLYISDSEKPGVGVSWSYVNYLKENGCDDIMYSVYADEPDIGMSTAYFLGLIPDCPDRKYFEN